MRKQRIEMLNDAKLCKHPCHITNMSADLSENFQNASGNLKKDGLHHYYCVQVDETPVGEAENIGGGQNKSIEIIEKFMKKFHHRLYRGNVYKKPEKGWCFHYFVFTSAMGNPYAYYPFSNIDLFLFLQQHMHSLCFAQ